jgi:flagellar motor switch protein FliG
MSNQQPTINEIIASTDTSSGIRRGAVLLFSVGEEHAIEVFRHLGPHEVQKISTAMAAIETLNHEEVHDAVRMFCEERVSRAPIRSTDEYLQRVLTEALGQEKAYSVLDKVIPKSTKHEGIETLRWMDPKAASELIVNEHPQIVATILVHLDPDFSGEVLSFLPERMRNEVLLRTATMQGVQPQALEELDEVLAQILSGSSQIRKSSVNGVDRTAEMINFLGSSMESSALGHIREFDADLAQKIHDKMFVFEDLISLDDRSIQKLLRELQGDTLIVALKGTSNQLRDHIFRNMTERASEILRDDLEAKGPVKLAEVEAQQKEILKIVRRLANEGLIIIGKGGYGDLVE